MKNKIVFVVTALRGGGAEKFVLSLYKSLEKYYDYECHIIALEKDVEHSIDGYKVHFVSDFCKVSKKGINRLFYKKNIAKKIDDYVINNVGENVLVLSNMLFSDKVMSESKLDVYHVIHSSYKSAFLSGKSWHKKLTIKQRINKIYRNHPLIFVSNAAKIDFEDAFKSKFNNQMIYNPTEIDDLIKLSLIDVPKLVDGEYFIHVGRFNHQKRHDRLLKAFSMMKEKEAKLLLLGDGGLKDRCQQLVKDLELQDRVIFAGFQSNPYPYISKSKGLLLTSDVEGLPTVLIEAIALNRPLLTTDCPGGVREIVNNLNSISPLNDLDKLASAMDKMWTEASCFTNEFESKFNSEHIAKSYHVLDLNRLSRSS